MNAKEIKSLYESKFREWVIRNKKVTYDEVIDILKNCATMFPPNNQISIAASDVDNSAIDKLRNNGFMVNLSRHEIIDDSPLFYLIGF